MQFTLLSHKTTDLFVFSLSRHCAVTILQNGQLSWLLSLKLFEHVKILTCIHLAGQVKNYNDPELNKYLIINI